MQLTQAILPIAGLGTRFLPWSKVVPKELLPLGNQPIVAHLVDECLKSGIRDICFVISRGKELILKYFEKHPTLEGELKKRGKTHHLMELQKYHEVRIHAVYQHEQKGDGHALLQAAQWVKSSYVAILFGDDYFVGSTTGLEQLRRAYEHLREDEHGAMLALENIPRELTERYGIVEVAYEHADNPRLKRVNNLVEKPLSSRAPSTLGIVGRYIIPQSIFTLLPSVQAGYGGEIRLIDALRSALPALPLYGYECEGRRIDLGTPESYKKAVQFF